MTPEALGYKKKAEKALQAAEVLLKEHLPEDALSRVYYAMFYGALAALSTLGIFPKTHKGVLLKFNERFILTGELPKETGRRLSDAFEKRQAVDYTLGYQISAEEVQRLLTEANQFLDDLSEILGI